MKRREFIGIAAGSAATAALPSLLRAADPALARLARPRLLEILRNPRIVEQLGRKYRATLPAEADVEGLARAMFGTRPSLIDPVLVARVDEMVRRDFTEGRTIIVGGWVLSLTEARQCALYSLLAA